MIPPGHVANVKFLDPISTSSTVHALTYYYIADSGIVATTMPECPAAMAVTDAFNNTEAVWQHVILSLLSSSSLLSLLSAGIGTAPSEPWCIRFHVLACDLVQHTHPVQAVTHDRAFAWRVDQVLLLYSAKP